MIVLLDQQLFWQKVKDAAWNNQCEKRCIAERLNKDMKNVEILYMHTLSAVRGLIKDDYRDYMMQLVSLCDFIVSYVVMFVLLFSVFTGIKSYYWCQPQGLRLCQLDGR